jgi:putative oxidoreductase
MGAQVHAGLSILPILGAVAGVLILGGLWTPVVGVLACIIEVWIAFTQPGTQPLEFMLATLGVILAMIGPGAWSIDARLYGRKQLLPPDS